MKILQTVVVKQIVTETSKKKLLENYMTKKLHLQKECDQLHFELKRLEKTKKFPIYNLKNHFEKEVQLRREKEKLLEFQIEQLHMLPLGSELEEKQVQAIVEVQVGDYWGDSSKQPAIIIKDGRITEIR